MKQNEEVGVSVESNAILQQFNKLLEKGVKKLRATSYGQVNEADDDCSLPKKNLSNNDLANYGMGNSRPERKLNPKKIYMKSKTNYPQFPLSGNNIVKTTEENQKNQSS